MKTRAVKASDIDRKWFVVDAQGQTLGRLASDVAQTLTGKRKPLYSPYIDTGDFVIVINAEKVAVTGKKLTQKMYYRHTQYPSGLRSVSLAKTLAAHPERVVEHAVRGMVPRGPLGDAMMRKLKVYAGPNHPHEAQVRGQEGKEAEA